MDEALERANAILRDYSASARGLFTAADVLFPAARRHDGAPLVWPYLYLAYDALQSGEPARGLAMAREAKKRTNVQALLANLVEWETIAAALQGGASAETIQLLQEAQAFNPFSDRIAANLHAMIAGEPAGAMRVANDTSSSDARERFREELRLAA